MATFERKFNGYRAVIVSDDYPDVGENWTDYLDRAEWMVNAGDPAAAWEYMRSIKGKFPSSCNYAYIQTPYNAVIFEHTDTIKDQLPHGSGINCDWVNTTHYLKSDRVKVVFRNSYHAMNENGMYDGWADFSVTVYFTAGGQLINDKTGKVYFDLAFHGQLAQYLNRKHLLREYLEEIIYYSFEHGEG